MTTFYDFIYSVINASTGSLQQRFQLEDTKYAPENWRMIYNIANEFDQRISVLDTKVRVTASPPTLNSNGYLLSATDDKVLFRYDTATSLDYPIPSWMSVSEEKFEGGYDDEIGSGFLKGVGGVQMSGSSGFFMPYPFWVDGVTGVWTVPQIGSLYFIKSGSTEFKVKISGTSLDNYSSYPGGPAGYHVAKDNVLSLALLSMTGSVNQPTFSVWYRRMRD